MLWITEYGERAGMKRFLADYDGDDPTMAVAPVVVDEKKKPS